MKNSTLSDGIALGVVKQRRNADQRRGQGQIVDPVKQQKCQDDQADRAAPKGPFSAGEVPKQIFHKRPPNKKASACTSSKT